MAFGYDPQEFIKMLREEDRQRREEIAKKKAVICEVLRKHGVYMLVAEYSGEGDSGNVEGTLAYRLADGFNPETDGDPTIGEGLEDVDVPRFDNHSLDEFVWECAYGTHPGFENNEGGHGSVIIWVDAERVVVEHWNHVLTEERADDVSY